MAYLRDDLRYALRLYRRTPLQSSVAIVVVAVAFAFTLAFFRLYDDLALQSPKGFEAPSELIGVGLSDAGAFDPRLPGGLRQAIAARSRTIETLAALVYVDNELVLDGARVDARSGVVSEHFFDGLGVRMHIGSRLESGEPRAGGDRAAVLDYEFWQRHYGGDPAVLGNRIEVGDAAFTVTGVTDEDFQGTHRGRAPDVWFPLRAFAASVWGAEPDAIADAYRMVSVARLAPGRSVEAARRELRLLSEELRGEFRDDLLGLRLIALEHLTPSPERHADAVRQVRFLVAAAALLALIAASNLSLFFLARVPGRQREMSIRLSIGATPYRLTRQLLIESSALVLAGVAFGLVAHFWLAELLRGQALFAGIEWRRPSRMDWPMAVFLVLVTLAVAATAAVAPVLNLARHSLAGRARRLHAGVARSQRVIVGVQLGLATIALSIALLFIESLVRTSSGDLGYESHEVSVVELARTDDDLPVGSAAVTRLRQDIAARLAAIDGVDTVGFGGTVPGLLAPDTYVVAIPGGGGNEIASQVARIAPKPATSTTSCSLTAGWARAKSSRR